MQSFTTRNIRNCGNVASLPNFIIAPQKQSQKTLPHLGSTARHSCKLLDSNFKTVADNSTRIRLSHIN